MRNKTIDAFRGLILIIMALDHASYFIINTHFYEGFDYINQYPDTLAFFTRWITHLCAPGFFFVMGYGLCKAYDHKKKSQLYLRALFIIALQFTLVNMIWDNPVIYFGVLNALGLSMIITIFMMPLIKKLGPFLFVLSLLMSHFIIHSEWIHTNSFILKLFFIPGRMDGSYILYTIFPWIGITFLGAYWASKKNISYLKWSMIFLCIFLIIKLKKIHTPASLLMVIKYPPSISFVTITMGLNLLIMHFMSRLNHIVKNFFIVYGKSPLFFYISHLLLFSLLSQYIHRTGYGILYITWLSGIIILYYPSKYAYRIKKRSI